MITLKRDVLRGSYYKIKNFLIKFCMMFKKKLIIYIYIYI